MALKLYDDADIQGIADAIRAKNGKTEKYTTDQMAAAVLALESGGGGLPTGFNAIAKGTVTLDSAVRGGKTFTVEHNLGEVPDMFIIYATQNIAQTYSMLGMVRSDKMAWRGDGYLTNAWYRDSSSTIAVNGTACTTSYGIKALTETQATITTHSSSTSYYWRAGTYEWIAIKFS
ncbi:MAG: hypothetical protein ACI4AO_02795 [Anaerotignum sp.]